MIEIENLDVAEERKVFTQSSGENLIPIDNHKAIWNLSKNELGCIASKDYNIIQHREVVKSLITAIGNLNVEFNANVRQDGHRIFLDISFPKTSLYIEEVGEEFIGGLRLINSYDKTTGLLILPRLERVICKNGMVVKKFVKGYAIRHNQRLVQSFEGIVENTLRELVDSCDKFKAMVNGCIEDSVEWKLVEIIMENLIYRRKHIAGILEKLEKKDKVTRWDIYNAITNYATHGEQLKPNIENWLQNKAQKVLEKPLKVLCEVRKEHTQI